MLLRRQRRQQRSCNNNSSNSCSSSSSNSCSSSSSSSSRRHANYLPGLLIVLLVLLQNFELHMCRQLMGANRRKDTDNDKDTNTDLDLDVDREIERRAGQPEEIFSAPSDGADMGYDEYPMIVPKRAALLLDRLMVALHHALENEGREGHRIGDFYAHKNLVQLKPTEIKGGMEQLQLEQEDGANMPMNSHTFHMYSDDDPGAMPDYDFKDWNQINRATGETLMAKSFQRRAGGVGAAAGNDATLLPTKGGSPSPAAAAAGAGAGVVPGPRPGPIPGHRRIHHVTNNNNGGGRMYWRCYFNAVSCF